MSPAGYPASILDDLPFQLATAMLAFRRFSDHTLRAVALDPMTPGSATILHVLAETDSRTVQSLVKTTRIANGTLTGLLDSLAGDGFVRRVANPDDGRSWIIRLTPKGRRLCAKLDQRHTKVMAVYRAALSNRETAELKRLLSMVTGHMLRHAEGECPIQPVRKRRPVARSR